MNLVEVFQRRQSAESAHRIGMPAFSGAIVHNRDGRSQASEQRHIVARLRSMVRNLVEINFSNLIHRTDEAMLDIPREISRIEEVKTAVAKQQHNTPRVVR